MEQIEQYYTVAEVAARLKVTKQAVYNWIYQGRLGYVMVGSEKRVTESDIQAFVIRKEPNAGSREVAPEGRMEDSRIGPVLAAA